MPARPRSAKGNDDAATRQSANRTNGRRASPAPRQPKAAAARALHRRDTNEEARTATTTAATVATATAAAAALTTAPAPTPATDRADSPGGWGQWVRRCRKPLVSIHEVDSFLQFNAYIRRGYRPSGLRKVEAAASVVLYLHNESVNILSHLLLAMAFLYLALWPPVPPAFAALHTGVGSSPAPAGHARVGASDTSAAGAVGGAAYLARQPPQRLWVDPTATVAATPASAFVPSAYGAGRFGDSRDGAARADARRGARGGWFVRHTDNPVKGILTPMCLGFVATFALSATYHTFMPCCRTRHGYHSLLQCDVLGVLSSITASAYVYFACGNACAAPAVLTVAGALMVLSTLCSAYAMVLAPLQLSLGTIALRLCVLLLDAAATAVLALWEGLRGGGLDVPSSHLDEHAFLLSMLRARRRWRHRLRALAQWVEDRTESPAADGQHAPASSAKETGGTHDGPLEAATSPTGLTAAQRAVIGCLHCTLHLVCYLLIVVPKRSPGSFGFLLSSPTSSSGRPSAGSVGYTQAVYFHGLSYVLLLVGSVFNVTRQPERLLWAMTRRARAYERRRAEYRAEAAVAAASTTTTSSSSSLLSGATGGLSLAGLSRMALSSVLPGCDGTWGGVKEELTTWLPAALCYVVVTYVLSVREIDYIGNSHNIWHVASAASALCALTGAYYDIVEYELMAPTC